MHAIRPRAVGTRGRSATHPHERSDYPAPGNMWAPFVVLPPVPRHSPPPMPTVDCALAPLVPYVPDGTSPWDRAAVRHLHRRLGYGIAPADADAVLAQAPPDYVTAGLDAAAALDPLPEPPWSDWVLSDYNGDVAVVAQQVQDWRSAWVEDMRANPWRAKLVLFWSNHFVTQLDVYQCPSYMWGYHDLLQRHAFGNFKDFVHAVGTDDAMLIYLNGVQNTRFAPNENYARELFELFTLGRDNGYTQDDVAQAARALTGYNGFVEPCAPIGYAPALHEPGTKTVFGVAVTDYDSLIDALFTERAVEVSTYVCGRLYRYYVSHELDAGVVAELAQTLRASDWELLPVYRQLFGAAHFFSPALRGGRVRDPLELVLTTETELATDALKTPEFTLALWYAAGIAGQELFTPPDVAGWPGGRAWINANLLSVRGRVTEDFIGVMYGTDRLGFVAWARSLDLASETDPAVVTAGVVDALLVQGLPTAEEYDRATEVFIGEVPSFYFEQGIWNLDFEYAPEQLALLLIYLLRRPEYQLS